MFPRIYILQMGEPFIHSLLEPQLNCNVFKRIFIGMECFTTLYQFLLYIKVNLLQAYIDPFIFWIAFPFRSPQSTEQSFFHCFLFLIQIICYNWRVITVQYCDFFFFCHISTLMSHRYTCVPHILKPHSPPSPAYSHGLFQSTGFECPALCIYRLE